MPRLPPVPSLPRPPTSPVRIPVRMQIRKPQAGDAGLGSLVLVDEVDPEARHPGEALLVGIAAFLGPGAVAPDFVLKGAALGQEPLVSGRST